MHFGAPVFKMATARIRNDEWKQDVDLKDTLTRYVKENLRRTEILDFVSMDFNLYSWSLRSLDRRLEYFNIQYTDRSVDLDDIETPVRQEMDGPGQRLGYRELRQVHDLNVLRDVYAVMCPVALEERAPQFKKKKPKGNFTSCGSNWVYSLDGHDKLMGYKNSTYPIAVHSCMDTCSRKIMWIRVWMSNSDPNIIGRFFLQHLYKSRKIAAKLRLDRGSETGVMATMHAFLRRHHGDMDPLETVIYGPSTSNQVIVIVYHYICYCDSDSY